MNSLTALRWISTVLAVSALGACRAPRQVAELLSDLKQSSEQDGLALVGINGLYIAVIPFDGPPRYFESEPPLYAGPISSGGHWILWEKWGQRRDERWLVQSIGGNQVAQLKPPALTAAVPFTLNEQAQRILYWEGDILSDKPNGALHWTSFDQRSGGIVGTSNGYADWAPDGNRVVWDKESQIYITDIPAGQERHLAAGRHPSWSPNGKWIAFVGTDGTARLIAPEGEPVASPLDRQKLAGLAGPHWSPDSRYLSFTQRNDSFSLWNSVEYRIAIVQIAGGRTVSIPLAGLAGRVARGARNFRWVLGYRDFCKSCKPAKTIFALLREPGQ